MIDDNKNNWIKIIITIILNTFIISIISSITYFIALDDARITVANSVKVKEEYYTTISIKNFKKETIDDVLLYLNNKFLILEIIGNEKTTYKDNYITVGLIPPKRAFSFIIKTKNELEYNCMSVESEKKIHISYTQNPIQDKLFYIVNFVILSILYGVYTLITMRKDEKERTKIKQDYNLRLDNMESKILEIRDQNDKSAESQKLLQDKLDNAEKKSNEAYIAHKKEECEKRIYYQIRIRDLKKELVFWHDTIRKLMYNSKNKTNSSDIIINTVTEELKTYTVNEKTKNEIDEIFYLSHILKDKQDNIISK